VGNDRCQVREVKLNQQNLLIRLGPWPMTSSGTLGHLPNLGDRSLLVPTRRGRTRGCLRDFGLNPFLAPTLFSSASIYITYTIPIVAPLAVYIYRLHCAWYIFCFHLQSCKPITSTLPNDNQSLQPQGCALGCPLPWLFTPLWPLRRATRSIFLQVD
jgi:hypothetical protein